MIPKGYTGKVNTCGRTLPMRMGPSNATPKLLDIPDGVHLEVSEFSNPSGHEYWAKTYWGKMIGWVCAHQEGVNQWWLNIDTTSAGTTVMPQAVKDKQGSQQASQSENDALAASLLNSQKGNFDYTYNDLAGSGVQYENQKIGTDSKDYISKYLNGDYDTYQQNIRKVVNNYNEPKYVQNSYGFPKLVGKENEMYKYNYYIDTTAYENQFKAIRENLNMAEATRRAGYLNSVKYYNRFKIAERENQLARSFAHVFFIRPDLNIMTYAGSGVYNLTDMVKNDATYYYASEHCPEILRELIHTCDSRTDDFMWSLSNAAGSFEISDEYIGADTYGESFFGHKIPYGKSDDESKSANTFNITYEDDRDLHIYHLHKLWIDYIAKMYKGKFRPKDQYAKDKILDYASAVYYIVTAEDGETILFWSKYYGVFPTNAPSSMASFQRNSLLKLPQFTINYNYAFKEDFNPLTLVEFNMHSPMESVYNYVKTYQKTVLGTGKTWVGVPFIETFQNQNGMDTPYTFKLRFRKGD